MSTWSGRLLGVVTWVVVVSVGAVLVWLVISRAGAGLVSEAGTVATQPAAPTSPQSSSDASPQPQRATWQGEAGLVTADCQGTDITLVGAQPADDVVVKVVDPGPDQLVVTFRHENGGSVTLLARCRGGRPDFTLSDGAAAPASPTGGTPSGTGSPTDSGAGDDSGHDDG